MGIEGGTQEVAGEEQGVGLPGCRESPDGELWLSRLNRAAHGQGGDDERGEYV